MSKGMKRTARFVLAIGAIIIGFSYASYHIDRWWNYKMSYKKQVEATVCSMVKPEALKVPCK